MSARELLELAAKATGLEPDPSLYDEEAGVCWSGKDADGAYTDCWNPLVNDPEAFALAAKLGYIELYWLSDCAVADFDDGRYMKEDYADHAGDRCAAMRRAIVRAAAEIGRGRAMDIDELVAEVENTPEGKTGMDKARAWLANELSELRDLSKCPRCGGEADNGHSRSDPPSPYVCTKCESKRFEDDLMQSVRQMKGNP